MKNLGFIDNAKSLLTKEYGDETYASKSEISQLQEVTNNMQDQLNELKPTVDGSLLILS